MLSMDISGAFTVGGASPSQPSLMPWTPQKKNHELVMEFIDAKRANVSAARIDRAFVLNMLCNPKERR
jgi:hypothetical protein